MHPDMIRSVGVLYQDAFGGPATAAVAQDYWDPETMFEFVADTEGDIDALFPTATVSARVLIVDPRDMTIFYNLEGHDQTALIDAINDLGAG